MNINKLNIEFEAMVPSDEKKAEVWKKIETEIEEREVISKKRKYRGFKKVLGTLAAMAAVFAVLIIPTTIFAEEIKDFFSGIFSQNKQVGKITEQKVFEVTDEASHIKVEVLELISDGHSAMATVVYTALDEKGREWIEQEENAENYYSLFSIHPGKVEKNENGIDVLMFSASSSFGCYELEKLRTEYSRTYIAYSSSYGTPTAPLNNCLIFNYSTSCDKSKLAELHCATMENHVYKMVKAEKNAEENEDSQKIEPVFFEISKLSWGVFGRNHEVYEHSGNSYRLIDPNDIYKPSIEIYFKNGESMPLEGGLYLYGNSVEVVELDGEKLDLNVCCGDFINERMFNNIDEHDMDDENWLLQIDPTDIVSVKLDGVMYNLE